MGLRVISVAAENKAGHTQTVTLDSPLDIERCFSVTVSSNKLTFSNDPELGKVLDLQSLTVGLPNQGNVLISGSARDGLVLLRQQCVASGGTNNERLVISNHLS